MKAVYVQKGDNLDYRNTGNALIEAGSVVVLGSRIGIAGTDILPGELGSLVMDGVYKLPKAAGEVIAAGTDVFYTEEGITAAPGGAGADAGTGEDDAQAGDTFSTAAGYAVVDAAADAAYVKVKLPG